VQPEGELREEGRMQPTGAGLAREVAKRVLAAHIARTGGTQVEQTPARREDPAGVDIRYVLAGVPRSARVRVDTYYGTDPTHIADRALPYYRAEARAYALEETADVATRTPGWVYSSRADDLMYYRMAIPRPEAEIAALLSAPDGVFLSELGIERDDLRIIPMAPLRDWFSREGGRFAPRPVITGGRSSWQRIVPFADLESAVPGVRLVGPVYRFLDVR